MKYVLLTAFLMAATLSAAAEVTHPFYLAPVGKVASDTRIAYQKFHVKDMINGFADYRTRDIIASQNFSYGIAPKVAIEAQISNAWNRQKYDGASVTDGEDTNIDWQMGATYDLYRQNDFYAQARVLYVQKETHHYNGAYKAFNALLKGGYDFGLILPYASAFVEVPIAMSKYADNNPKYAVNTGRYKDQAAQNQYVALKSWIREMNIRFQTKIRYNDTLIRRLSHANEHV